MNKYKWFKAARAQQVLNVVRTRRVAIESARGLIKTAALIPEPSLSPTPSVSPKSESFVAPTYPSLTQAAVGGAAGGLAGGLAGIPLGLLVTLLSDKDKDGSKPWLRNALLGAGLGAGVGGIGGAGIGGGRSHAQAQMNQFSRKVGTAAPGSGVKTVKPASGPLGHAAEGISGATGLSGGAVQGAMGGGLAGIPLGVLIALLRGKDEEGNTPWASSILGGLGIGALGGGLLGNHVGQGQVQNWMKQVGLGNLFGGGQQPQPNQSYMPGSVEDPNNKNVREPGFEYPDNLQSDFENRVTTGAGVATTPPKKAPSNESVAPKPENKPGPTTQPAGK